MLRMQLTHPMSAKNSAEAEPARKMSVWYLAAASGPAITAYLLQHHNMQHFEGDQETS
jgi:hypothetical protein